MGTSIVKFSKDSDTQSDWGILKGDKVYPFKKSFLHHRDVMDCYFNTRENFNTLVTDEPILSSRLKFHSPVSDDIQMFAQGLNYASHREEAGLVQEAEKEENLVFCKHPSSLCGPNDDILRPHGVELLDYEIELGVILKKSINEPTQVTDENLGDYLGALVLCNDVSARDLMFGGPMLQWFKGKSQRTFCPAGPVLYLLDEGEVNQLYSLELTLKMNGEVKQQGSTDQLIHKPPKTLTDISQYANLNAGDCILTGTPGGVLGSTSLKTGLAIMLNFKNPKKRRQKFTSAQKSMTTFLQPGDFLELEIKSLDGSINLGKQKSMIAQA